MTNEELTYYSSYRVRAPGNKTYRAKNMPEDVLAERRAFMRQILNKTSFQNADNAKLDNMLLLPVDKAYIVEDTDGYQFYINTSGISRKEAAERVERAMIPQEYKRKFFKDFNWSLYGEETVQQSRIVSTFVFNYREFAEKGMGLYLYSEVKGSGKTMLSCIILNEISSKYGINTKFITATDFLRITKKSYKGSDDEVDMIRRASLLVIDDIGTQLNREWTDTVFYELVNYRYNTKLPTIYTSNVPTNALKMDERTTDRIERNTILLKIPEKPIRKINGSREKEKFIESMGILKGSSCTGATPNIINAPESVGALSQGKATRQPNK